MNQSSILATGMLICVRHPFLILWLGIFSNYCQFVALRNTLMFDVFFWLMGKCMFGLMSVEDALTLL